MGDDDQFEREVRAARNHALFRAINEKLRLANEALSFASNMFVIACECADVGCLETIEIEPDAYMDIRGHPNRFAVRHGHVYDDVESVVGEEPGYVIVAKNAAGAEIAEATNPLS